MNRPFIIHRGRVPEGLTPEQFVQQAIMGLLGEISRQTNHDCYLHSVDVSPIGIDELLIVIVAEWDESKILTPTQGQKWN